MFKTPRFFRSPKYLASVPELIPANHGKDSFDLGELFELDEAELTRRANLTEFPTSTIHEIVIRPHAEHLAEQKGEILDLGVGDSNRVIKIPEHLLFMPPELRKAVLLAEFVMKQRCEKPNNNNVGGGFSAAG